MRSSAGAGGCRSPRGSSSSAALGLAGLPPLGVWLGKSLLEHAVPTAHLSWLLPLTLLSSVLTGGAVLRVTARVFTALGADPRQPQEPVATEAPEADTERCRPAVSMLAPAWVLLATSVVAAALPSVSAGAATAAASFVDTDAYVTEVLRPGTQAAAATGTPSAVWTVSAVGLGVVSAALACVVAAVALWGRALPSTWHDLTKPARVIGRGLHAVHTTHLGNHVAWLVLGAAALAVMVT
jgi:multicomponent Na+:H+ antiporter subunit D